MIIHKREMILNEDKNTDYKTDGCFVNCQASFNSDGKITLRKYERNNNQDEIVVFSSEETEALFALFSRIGTKCRNYTLPF